MSSKRDEEASPDADDRTLRERERPESFKERVGHFTWSNYACTMSTGAIAVVLSQQPFTFTGLDVIAKIFFILDLVLFITFSVVITARFYMQPWKLLKSLHHPNEALFFGSAWVSIALLLNLTATYGIPVCGLWLRIVMEVLFWMYSAFALMVAIFQYLTLFVANNIPVSSAMPALVFPVYPFLVIGPLAGVMLPHYTEGQGLPILLGGICFQGLGWTVAIFMYSIYIVRLLSSELPDPSKRPGMFISVGPAGYTSAALVSLGTQASVLIPHNFMSLGDFNTGATIKVIGVMAGIFLWLVAFWFFALSLVAILTGVKEMSFTLNWWAMVFPNAGLTLALIQIGSALDSPGIKAVTSGMSILLVIAWFFVAGYHISAIFRKQIYMVGCDEDNGMVPPEEENEKKD